MAETKKPARPLSPHLTIYRPQLTSISSILTRITGNALLVGALLVVWWFVAAATSPEYFAFADAIVTSWLGDLVMCGSLWAIWYQTWAGVRHLFWDNGVGLELATALKLGWAVVYGSFRLTAVSALIIVSL